MNTGESISVFSMSDFYCLQICLQIVINYNKHSLLVLYGANGLSIADGFIFV